jgi:hypothetical protein
MHPAQRAKQRRRIRSRDNKRIMNKLDRVLCYEAQNAGESRIQIETAGRCLHELYRRGALQ